MNAAVCNNTPGKIPVGGGARMGKGNRSSWKPKSLSLRAGAMGVIVIFTSVIMRRGQVMANKKGVSSQLVCKT